jgi:hypothetical protein
MLVAIEDKERPVKNEIRLDTTIMINAPANPACPTTHPVRKKRIIPRMVRMFGVNTPAKLPKRPCGFVLPFAWIAHGPFGWEKDQVALPPLPD